MDPVLESILQRLHVGQAISLTEVESELLYSYIAFLEEQAGEQPRKDDRT